MDLAGLIIGILGLIIGVIGTLVAVREYQKRHRIERVFKTITQGFPGDVAKIEESCKWANVNVRDALKVITQLPDSDAKQKATIFLGNAIGDTGTSKRMCMQLFNNLLGVQKAQFDTRIVVHPEKNTLELCKLESTNNNPQDIT